jgi:hypothetical protein
MEINSTEVVEQFLIPRIRMQAARLGVPASKPPRDQQLDDWLDSLPLLATMSKDSGIEYEVSVTGKGDRLTWRASGLPQDFMPVMNDYWHEVGASSLELEKLQKIGKKLLPDILGSWIEATESGIDTGWYFPFEIPIEQALDIASPSEANDIVSEWADEFDLDICDRLGATLADGYPYTAIQIPVLRDDIEEQIYIALELFSALKLPAPPESAIGAILTQAEGELSISIWLTSSGISKLGILVSDPSNRLLIDLCHVADIQDLEFIAGFQGLLSVENPTLIECQQRSNGFGIEIHYLLQELKVDINS